jgi:hypothetical protein
MQVWFTLYWSGLSQGKPLSHKVVEGWAISALNGLLWETELHFYRGRRHPHFPGPSTALGEGMGEVLSRKGSNSEDATDNDRNGGP